MKMTWNMQILAKFIENIYFLPFFQFFWHLLFPQLLGTHFFGFLANFYVDVGLFYKIFFMKMTWNMQILAKFIENIYFLPFFQFFWHLLFPQLLGTHFFGFLANFYVDIGLFHWIFFMKVACINANLRKKG